MRSGLGTPGSRVADPLRGASDAAVAWPPGELNETGTVIPGTGPRMVYGLPEVARTTGREASRSLWKIWGPRSGRPRFSEKSAEFHRSRAFLEFLFLLIFSRLRAKISFGDLRTGKIFVIMKGI